MLNDQTGELTSALAARDADRFWAVGRQMLAMPTCAVRSSSVASAR